MRYQITCVRKLQRANPLEGITQLGGPGWGRLARDRVVTLIEARIHTYHTEVCGRRAEVEVVREPGRRPYLRTRTDGAWNDDLLALPEIPAAAHPTVRFVTARPVCPPAYAAARAAPSSAAPAVRRARARAAAKG